MGVKIDYHGLVVDSEDFSNAWNGSYEQVELSMVNSVFLRGRHRVLVAGGGMGLVAAMAAARVGVENVLVYEPIPGFAKLISSNIKVDGVGLTVVGKCLAVEAGSVFFTVDPQNWALSRFSSTQDLSEFSISVDAHSMLEVMKASEINALALDVEGAELELLAIPGVLHRLSALVLEIHTTIIGIKATAGLIGLLVESGLYISRQERRLKEDIYFISAVRE